jgi:Domain of unknown function (DUF1942)
VNSLRRSSDVVPFPVAGRLWQATATVDAQQGTVAPIVSDFKARAATGQTYRVLANVATPQNVNPAPLGQLGVKAFTSRQEHSTPASGGA